ncbi:MAG: hypothetical protein N3C61_02290 [Candidatus Micrarchaeota archaeon]|nr:hypothetical protein [Candidatus Micrarchaeota archaeon]
MTLRLLVLLVLFSVFVYASSCDQGGFISEECLERDIFGKFDQNSFEAAIKRIFQDTKTSTMNMIENFIVNVIAPYTVCKSTNPVDATTLLNTTAVIVFISMMLVFILNGVASMLGSQWRISVLEEGLQGLISILVVLIIVSVLNYYTTNNIFQESKKYIVNLIVNFSFFTMLLKTLETMMIGLSNLTLPFGPPDARGIFSISFSQLFTIIFKSLDVIKGFFSLGILEYVFKLFILCIGPHVIIQILLPVGILMRAFYFTRPGGNVLVGISIAFIMIYPIIMYVYSKIYNSISMIWDVYLTESVYRLLVGIMGGIAIVLIPLAIKAFIGMTFNQIANIAGIANIWMAIRRNVEIINMNSFGIASVLNLTQIVPVLYYLVFGYLQLALIFGAILGPLALYLTVSLTGQISRALGTEINIAALSRLI